MPVPGKRRAAKRAVSDRGRSRAPRVASAVQPSSAARYKVVELSTVDEASIESTLNQWAGLGWHFEGMQFAMRESSRRPSMAFVLFTRPWDSERGSTDVPPSSNAPRVVPLSGGKESAWDRLRRLADDEDPSERLVE